jgi:hypothetical protein
MQSPELIPPSSERVRRHTDEESNERITRQTEANVAAYASGDRRVLDLRLQELDREWDIERVLEANAATVSLIGLSLAGFAHRRWMLLPIAVAGFLLQHAVQGWCPPVSLFRRFGVRTSREIDEERYALKVLRGDFSRVEGNGPRPADHVLRAVRA